MEVVTITDTPDKIPWHPGFCGAAELEFRANLSELTFITEFNLSREPLRTDLLILKKKPGVRIENETGRIFKNHNIIEYKSPEDSMNIDDFFKTIGYACLYKASGKTVNQFPADEITVSLFRDSFPRELFARLRESGRTIEEKYPGVYYVHGNTLFDTQVVVTSRLDKKSHYTFRVLSKKADREDVRKFLKDTAAFTSPGDKANADAVFQVSIAANKPLYDEIRRESDMCQAMEELMKDVIDARVEERAALLAEEKAIQMAEEKAVQMAEEKAVQMAEEKAIQMAEEKAVQMAEEKAIQMAEEKAIQMAEEKAEKIVRQAVAQAVAQAGQQADKNTAVRMYKKGLPVEMISELIDRSADLVKQWISPAAV